MKIMKTIYLGNKLPIVLQLFYLIGFNATKPHWQDLLVFVWLAAIHMFTEKTLKLPHVPYPKSKYRKRDKGETLDTYLEELHNQKNEHFALLDKVHGVNKMILEYNSIQTYLVGGYMGLAAYLIYNIWNHNSWISVLIVISVFVVIYSVTIFFLLKTLNRCTQKHHSKKYSLLKLGSLRVYLQRTSSRYLKI